MINQAFIVLVGSGSKGQQTIFTTGPSESTKTVAGIDCSALSCMLCPSKSSALGSVISITVDNTLFITLPTPVSKHNIHTAQQSTSNNNNNNQNRRVDHVTHFALTIGLSPAPEPQEEEEELLQQFSHLLFLLVKALQREQSRCGFLSTELNLLYNLSDMYKDWKDLAHDAQDKSELAREIALVGDQLKRGGPIRVRINEWLEVGLQLRNLNNSSSFSFKKSSTNLVGDDVSPYNACVVEEKEARKVPQDGLSVVQRVAEHISPQFSLHDIALRRDISTSTCVRVAKHLEAWELARPLPRLTLSSVLVISSSTPLPPSYQLCNEFNSRFPDLPCLPQIMAYFSKPHQLGYHVELAGTERTAMFVQAVVWMLKRQILQSVSTYALLIIPHSLLHSLSFFVQSTSPSSFNIPEGGDYIHPGGPLNDFLWACIQTINQDFNALSQFRQIIPFLDGKTPLREIAWKLHKSKDTIEHILSRFSEVVELTSVPI